MKVEELIAHTLDVILSDSIYANVYPDEEPPEEETEWARELIMSRIEELTLVPTEEAIYSLMKIRMKV